VIAKHAFISYVREDSQYVDRLQQILEDAGISVWRDTSDLWPGQDWRVMIKSWQSNSYDCAGRVTHGSFPVAKARAGVSRTPRGAVDPREFLAGGGAPRE
jgi:hypothetical protein